MGKPFFTKKQKAAMRERKKRKRLQLTTLEQTNDETAPRAVQEPLNGAADSNKRQRTESLTEHAEPEKPQHEKKTELEIQTKIVNGIIHVLMPSDLSSKDARKYRKDARRKLRQEGKDDSNIEYITSDSVMEPKKKKKKSFPSIQELLKQQKIEVKQQKEEQKIQKKINEIPDYEKAQYVALDCEMVGIGTDGKKSALARVSLVDWDGNELLDTFVKVPIRVTDFRTHVSGVEPKHIKDQNAMEVEKCRDLVASLLKDKILVGHALSNDLRALMLTHHKHKIRDTAKYRPFQRYGNGKWRARKLRDLVKENLKDKEGFQEGEHDSVQDARATMELFHLVRSQWEKELTGKTK
ncbi:unnamed protein product [Cylindrotheca closterium]|uniref:RNA exonuclease 4 n=1 Tax=Cylindrotheca closterium TaxID=2856 RepID=A0AAD2FGF1_9STRA|nr:unnamed protein product [Cylindrotheca closterium]